MYLYVSYYHLQLCSDQTPLNCRKWYIMTWGTGMGTRVYESDMCTSLWNDNNTCRLSFTTTSCWCISGPLNLIDNKIEGQWLWWFSEAIHSKTMFVFRFCKINLFWNINSHKFLHLLNMKPTYLCSELSPESSATGILKIEELWDFLKFSLSLRNSRVRVCNSGHVTSRGMGSARDECWRSSRWARRRTGKTCSSSRLKRTEAFLATLFSVANEFSFFQYHASNCFGGKAVS